MGVLRCSKGDANFYQMTSTGDVRRVRSRLADVPALKRVVVVGEDEAAPFGKPVFVSQQPSQAAIICPVFERQMFLPRPVRTCETVNVAGVFGRRVLESGYPTVAFSMVRRICGWSAVRLARSCLSAFFVSSVASVCIER